MRVGPAASQSNGRLAPNSEPAIWHFAQEHLFTGVNRAPLDTPDGRILTLSTISSAAQLSKGCMCALGTVPMTGARRSETDVMRWRPGVGHQEPGASVSAAARVRISSTPLCHPGGGRQRPIPILPPPKDLETGIQATHDRGRCVLPLSGCVRHLRRKRWAGPAPILKSKAE